MSVEWTDEKIKELSDLWKEGLPTGEIGRRLGFTKNAVIGKAHRLGLPKRQSPIQSRPEKARKAAAATTGAKAPASAPVAANAKADVAPAQAKPAKGRDTKAGKVITLDRLSAGMCCWPKGEPGKPEFRFCGAPSVPGKPYCQPHCDVAYVKSSKGGDKSNNNSNNNNNNSSTQAA